MARPLIPVQFQRFLPHSMNDTSRDRSSDNELLNQYRNGDEDAALELYYRYAARLLQLTSKNTSKELSPRLDPEDVVQSVFRTFFRRAASGQYAAPEGDELWKLLLVIALNKVRTQATFHSAGKRDARKTESISAGMNDPISEVETQGIARAILKMSVDELIMAQPTSHQGIIRLRIDGFDVQSIAKAQRRSKRTVERVLQSFREQLMDSALVASGVN